MVVQKIGLIASMRNKRSEQHICVEISQQLIFLICLFHFRLTIEMCRSFLLAPYPDESNVYSQAANILFPNPDRDIFGQICLQQISFVFFCFLVGSLSVLKHLNFLSIKHRTNHDLAALRGRLF